MRALKKMEQVCLFFRDIIIDEYLAVSFLGDQQHSSSEDEVIALRPSGIGALLLVNFQRFKLDGKFIDAKICCHDQILFACHKLVLASFSAYFETLLLNIEGPAILNLDAVDALYVRQLATIIDYMYGKTNWIKPDALDILRDAAHLFGVQALESGELERIRKRMEKDRLKSSLTDKLDQLRNGGESAATAVVVSKTTNAGNGEKS